MNRRTLPLSVVVCVSIALAHVPAADAQTATFSGFNDALAGRCYEPASTAPDPGDPNVLRIGMVACAVSSPNGSATVLMDTIQFVVEAPPGYFVSRITFTQNGTTAGSRGGAGFRGATWVVAETPQTVPLTSGGWSGQVDLGLLRRTVVPIAITTYIAAYGIQVVSGSASASNPLVRVELAPQ